jgi:hypothetical protein
VEEKPKHCRKTYTCRELNIESTLVSDSTYGIWKAAEFRWWIGPNSWLEQTLQHQLQVPQDWQHLKHLTTAQ